MRGRQIGTQEIGIFEFFSFLRKCCRMTVVCNLCSLFFNDK
jgi:hypothetical protein